MLGVLMVHQGSQGRVGESSNVSEVEVQHVGDCLIHRKVPLSASAVLSYSVSTKGTCMYLARR